MNEWQMEEAWLRDFEQSKPVAAARAAATLARVRREAALRAQQLANPFDTRAQQAAFRNDFNRQQSGVDDVELKALRQGHDQEVRDYEEQRRAEAWGNATRGSVGNFTSAEPDFANEFPWVNAKRAFVSGAPDPGAVMALERRRSMGSGTPMTDVDEVALSRRYNIRAPAASVTRVDQATRDREQAATRTAANEEANFNRLGRVARMTPEERLAENAYQNARGAGYGADYAEQQRRITSWQNTPQTYTDDELWMMEGADPDPEGDGDDDAFGEFTPQPVLAPIGGRPINPPGSLNAPATRASVIHLPPWRLPSSYANSW